MKFITSVILSSLLLAGSAVQAAPGIENDSKARRYLRGCPSGQVGTYGSSNQQYQCIPDPCTNGLHYQWNRRNGSYSCVAYSVPGGQGPVQQQDRESNTGNSNTVNINAGNNQGGNSGNQGGNSGNQGGNSGSQGNTGSSNTVTINAGNQGNGGSQGNFGNQGNSGSGGCPRGQLGVYSSTTRRYECKDNPCSAGQHYQVQKGGGYSCVDYYVPGGSVPAQQQDRESNGGNSNTVTINAGQQQDRESNGGNSNTVNINAGNQGGNSGNQGSGGSVQCGEGQVGILGSGNTQYQCIDDPCAAGEIYQWSKGKGYSCVTYTARGNGDE